MKVAQINFLLTTVAILHSSSSSRAIASSNENIQTKSDSSTSEDASHDDAFNSIISNYYTTDPFFGMRVRHPQKDQRSEDRQDNPNDQKVDDGNQIPAPLLVGGASRKVRPVRLRIQTTTPWTNDNDLRLGGLTRSKSPSDQPNFSENLSKDITSASWTDADGTRTIQNYDGSNDFEKDLFPEELEKNMPMKNQDTSMNFQEGFSPPLPALLPEIENEDRREPRLNSPRDTKTYFDIMHDFFDEPQIDIFAQKRPPQRFDLGAANQVNPGTHFPTKIGHSYAKPLEYFNPLDKSHKPEDVGFYHPPKLTRPNVFRAQSLKPRGLSGFTTENFFVDIPKIDSKMEFPNFSTSDQPGSGEAYNYETPFNQPAELYSRPDDHLIFPQFFGSYDNSQYIVDEPPEFRTLPEQDLEIYPSSTRQPYRERSVLAPMPDLPPPPEMIEMQKNSFFPADVPKLGSRSNYRPPEVLFDEFHSNKPSREEAKVSTRSPALQHKEALAKKEIQSNFDFHAGLKGIVVQKRQPFPKVNRAYSVQPVFELEHAGPTTLGLYYGRPREDIHVLPYQFRAREEYDYSKPESSIRVKRRRHPQFDAWTDDASPGIDASYGPIMAKQLESFMEPEQFQQGRVRLEENNGSFKFDSNRFHAKVASEFDRQAEMINSFVNEDSTQYENEVIQVTDPPVYHENPNIFTSEDKVPIYHTTPKFDEAVPPDDKQEESHEVRQKKPRLDSPARFEIYNPLGFKTDVDYFRAKALDLYAEQSETVKNVDKLKVRQAIDQKKFSEMMSAATASNQGTWATLQDWSNKILTHGKETLPK